jgi:hypothetical protein
MFTTSTNYVYTTFNPEAHITVGKNRLKKYGDKYYLKDGQTFEIELKNPTHNRVKAIIEMNGKRISDTGLVIPAGNSSHYIERYIDEARKFKFKTFHVDDVEETEEARERNGLIRIRFYAENVPLPTTAGITWTNLNAHTTYDTYTGGYVYTSNSGNPNLTNSSRGIESTSTAFDPASMVVYSMDAPQVETGRVTEGGKSSQRFDSVSANFYSMPFHTVEFQLLPESTKPMEITEIRNYCPECGLRIRKSSWKYCPTCGTEL